MRHKFAVSFVDRTTLFAFLVILSTLIIDTSIVKVSVFTRVAQNINLSIEIFIISFFSYTASQFFILKLIRQRKNAIKSLPLNVVDKFFIGTQFVLSAIFILIILQMLVSSEYNIVFFEASVWISCSIPIILLGILAKKFFSWFLYNPSLIIILYGVAMITLCMNSLFIILTVINLSATQQELIKPLTRNIVDADNIFNSGYVITSILSFILVWVPTVLVLKYYLKKMARAKFWTLVVIPLVYFLSQFQTLFVDLFAPLRFSDPVLFGIVYTLIISETKLVGGILFGATFWMAAIKVRHHIVKEYMAISGYGVMLMFSSSQITSLTLVTYPPFGLFTTAFMSLASYLVLVGIYSTALSLAEDMDLRRSIKKTLEKEKSFLGTIGLSQIQNEMQRRVTRFTNEFSQKSKSLFEETGVQPSLGEEEIREYLKLTLDELKTLRDYEKQKSEWF
jgi:hypothetical protein